MARSKDSEIIKRLAQFVYLRISDVQELTGRGERAVQGALRRLGSRPYLPNRRKKGDEKPGLGLIDYVIESASTELGKFSEKRVHFLTQRGWDYALRHGFIKQPVTATAEKSNLMLDHDLALTDYHLALWRKWGDKLEWRQYHHVLYHRFGKGENDMINADAYFWIEAPGHPAFFVEMENIREHSYDAKGNSKLVRKGLAFDAFADGHYQEEERFAPSPDFRVIFIRTSQTLAVNAVKKYHTHGRPLRSGRFWFTDIHRARSGADRIYSTPTDYENALHAVEDTVRT